MGVLNFLKNIGIFLFRVIEFGIILGLLLGLDELGGLKLVFYVFVSMTIVWFLINGEDIKEIFTEIILKLLGGK